jgi:hypothetical protein
MTQCSSEAGLPKGARELEDRKLELEAASGFKLSTGRATARRVGRQRTSNTEGTINTAPSHVILVTPAFNLQSHQRVCYQLSSRSKLQMQKVLVVQYSQNA